MLRRARQRLANGTLALEQRVLLAEADEELVGVAVVDGRERRAGLVGLIAVHRDLHGATTPELHAVAL